MHKQSVSPAHKMHVCKQQALCELLKQVSTSELLWQTVVVEIGTLLAEALASQHVQMSEGAPLSCWAVSHRLSHTKFHVKPVQAALGLCRELVCLRCCVKQPSLLLSSATIGQSQAQGCRHRCHSIAQKTARLAVLAFCFGETKLLPCLPSSSWAGKQSYYYSCYNI